MKSHNPTDIRKKLGVDHEVLLSPKSPQPEVREDNQMDCLTHDGVFSAQECARIIAGVEPDDWRDHTSEEQWRHSQTVWLPREEDTFWVFDKMLALVMSANQTKYLYEIDFFEALHVARYDAPMHYDWHTDIGPGLQGNRKLSVSVQLSSPEDYEGGELLMDIQGEEPFVCPKEIGSVTVSPSFLRRKVTPVTKGSRYALVAWCSGTNRFR